MMSDADRDLERAVALVSANPDLRILRRFTPRDSYGIAPKAFCRSATFIDFETTGVEAFDVPIEIGMVRVAYDPDTGDLGEVLDRYSGLEDPRSPLRDEIKALTGLKDEDLAGRRFDDDRVLAITKDSNVLVAHNAEFDFRMGEARFPFMAKRRWGCTLRDVPWKAYGVSSGKLDYIAMTRGLFHDGHRAQIDAELTAELMSRDLGDGRSAMRWVLEAVRRDWYRVWATDAPFGQKGTLSGRGYEWKNAPQYEHKAWRIDTDDPEGEVAFLKDCVYEGKGKVLVQKVGPLNRFTERAESAKWVSMARQEE